MLTGQRVKAPEVLFRNYPELKKIADPIVDDVLTRICRCWLKQSPPHVPISTQHYDVGAGVPPVLALCAIRFVRENMNTGATFRITRNDKAFL